MKSRMNSSIHTLFFYACCMLQNVYFCSDTVAEKIVDPLLQLWAKFYEIDKDLTDSCPGKKRKFASDSFLPEAISHPTVEAHK